MYEVYIMDISVTDWQFYSSSSIIHALLFCSLRLKLCVFVFHYCFLANLGILRYWAYISKRSSWIKLIMCECRHCDGGGILLLRVARESFLSQTVHDIGHPGKCEQRNHLTRAGDSALEVITAKPYAWIFN